MSAEWIYFILSVFGLVATVYADSIFRQLQRIAAAQERIAFYREVEGRQHKWFAHALDEQAKLSRPELWKEPGNLQTFPGAEKSGEPENGKRQSQPSPLR